MTLTLTLHLFHTNTKAVWLVTKHKLPVGQLLPSSFHAIQRTFDSVMALLFGTPLTLLPEKTYTACFFLFLSMKMSKVRKISNITTLMWLDMPYNIWTTLLQSQIHSWVYEYMSECVCIARYFNAIKHGSLPTLFSLFRLTQLLYSIKMHIWLTKSCCCQHWSIRV